MKRDYKMESFSPVMNKDVRFGIDVAHITATLGLGFAQKVRHFEI